MALQLLHNSSTTALQSLDIDLLSSRHRCEIAGQLLKSGFAPQPLQIRSAIALQLIRHRYESARNRGTILI
jgi:hypothetical protein